MKHGKRQQLSVVLKSKPDFDFQILIVSEFEGQLLTGQYKVGDLLLKGHVGVLADSELD
jgi:hypothetical protein